jgi:small subunit ribosomal protein S15
MALTKEEKQGICNEFGKSTVDTGSAEVQIALLTQGIKVLTEHCQKNPHDHSSRRGLLKMVTNRRVFSHYLQRKDSNKYKELVAKLGLRK